MPQSDWISVDDDLPEGDGEVWVCGYEAIVPRVTGWTFREYTGVGFFAVNRWWKSPKGTAIHVTHWMNKPGLPED